MKVQRLILFVVTACGLFSLPGHARWIEDNPEEAPRAVRTVSPTVPRPHALHAIDGKVKVEFFLSDEGQPIDIRIVDTTHRDYAHTVRRALRQWRFERSGADSLWTGVRYSLTFVIDNGRA